MSTGAPDCDVLIVGGGLVGASLALALRDTPLTVTLVEPFAPESQVSPSFDERTTALGNGSRRVFEALGLWKGLSGEAAPIRRIHISDAGHFGFARLDAADFGQPALGYVIANRIIGRELWSALRASAALTVHQPARVTAVRLGHERAEVTVQKDGRDLVAGARLVVAADGTQSLVRQAAGIQARREDYHQTAVIATVRTDQPNDGCAYERFTSEGPMALLPLAPPQPGHWRGLVWASEPAKATALLALSPAEFLARWQQAFGWRAGRALQLGSRASYPLALVQAEATVAQRAVLLGNASQSLHPVAGQGFNLGLRDAASLAETLAAAARAGEDVGCAAVLARFACARAEDREGVVGFTDRLVRTFSDSRGAVASLRNMGLLAFDLLPPAKRALGRISYGFGRSTPGLTRGVGLP